MSISPIDVLVAYLAGRSIEEHKSIELRAQGQIPDDMTIAPGTLKNDSYTDAKLIQAEALLLLAILAICDAAFKEQFKDSENVYTVLSGLHEGSDAAQSEGVEDQLQGVLRHRLTKQASTLGGLRKQLNKWKQGAIDFDGSTSALTRNQLVNALKFIGLLAVLGQIEMFTGSILNFKLEKGTLLTDLAEADVFAMLNKYLQAVDAMIVTHGEDHRVKLVPGAAESEIYSAVNKGLADQKKKFDAEKSKLEATIKNLKSKLNKKSSPSDEESDSNSDSGTSASVVDASESSDDEPQPAQAEQEANYVGGTSDNPNAQIEHVANSLTTSHRSRAASAVADAMRPKTRKVGFTGMQCNLLWDSLADNEITEEDIVAVERFLGYVILCGVALWILGAMVDELFSFEEFSSVICDTVINTIPPTLSTIFSGIISCTAITVMYFTTTATGGFPRMLNCKATNRFGKTILFNVCVIALIGFAYASMTSTAMLSQNVNNTNVSVTSVPEPAKTDTRSKTCLGKGDSLGLCSDETNATFFSSFGSFGSFGDISPFGGAFSFKLESILHSATTTSDHTHSPSEFERKGKRTGIGLGKRTGIGLNYEVNNSDTFSSYYSSWDYGNGYWLKDDASTVSASGGGSSMPATYSDTEERSATLEIGNLGTANSETGYSEASADVIGTDVTIGYSEATSADVNGTDATSASVNTTGTTNLGTSTVDDMADANKNAFLLLMKATFGATTSAETSYGAFSFGIGTALLGLIAYLLANSDGDIPHLEQVDSDSDDEYSSTVTDLSNCTILMQNTDDTIFIDNDDLDVFDVALLDSGSSTVFVAEGPVRPTASVTVGG